MIAQVKEAAMQIDRETVIRLAKEAGFGSNPFSDALARHSNGYWVDVLGELEHFAALVAQRAAEAERGEDVVTKNDAGHIVAVTRQDEEGRILSVLSMSAPIYSAAPVPLSDEMPEGWQMVPIQITEEMEVAAENDYEMNSTYFPRWGDAYQAMLAAAPQPPEAAKSSVSNASNSGLSTSAPIHIAPPVGGNSTS